MGGLRLFEKLLAGLVLALAGWWTVTLPKPAAPMAAGRPLVVIDPGHGGIDPGAVAPGGVMEKHVNLAIARLTAEQLSARGVAVALTRSGDSPALAGSRYVVVSDLRYRAWMARHLGATLLISIHVNSESTHTVFGPIVYYGRHSAPSKQLAESLAQTLSASTGSRHPPRPAGHFILREAPMPAATVEVGFVTHPGDLVRITTRTYQKTLARALAEGVMRFLGVSGTR